MRILGVERTGNGLPCVFHGGSDSMSLKEFDDGWRWKCWSCRKNGDIITAMAILQHKSDAEMVKELRESGRYEKIRDDIAKRLLPKRRVKYVTLPVPDEDRLMDFMAKSCDELSNSWEYVAQFGRGVNPETATRFMVGFRRYIKFREWSYAVQNAWCFPIARPDGKVLAVKLHLETEPPAPHTGKSRWAPFGTVPTLDLSAKPSIKPICHYLTWWPRLEMFDKKHPVMIQPGEHKALTAIARGYQAVSHTQGESLVWTVSDAQLFGGWDVLIGYDDDDDKVHPKDGLVTNTGHTFRDETVRALYPYANSIKLIHLGKKADYQTK